jgi:HAE1 family hydrophobic/amphiphilic exporter-1
MRLPELSIRRPVTTIIVTLLILLLGLVSLRGIGIDLLPDMTFPTIIVLTRYPGSGPAEVENLVTRRIEEAIGSVTNVKAITSMSQEGVSMVFPEFEWGTNMDTAGIEVRERIDLIKRYLPEGTLAPTIVKADPSMIPAVYLSMSGGRDMAQLTALAEDLVKPRLERLDGVSSAAVIGGVKREVHVYLDPVRLHNYGISPQQVANVLMADNINLPGGTVEESGTRLVLRTMGEFQSLEDIERTLVPTAMSSMALSMDGLTTVPPQIMIRDIARVEYGYAERDQIARVNKEPSIGIVIQKQTGTNTVQVSNRVLSEIDTLKRELPPTVDLSVVFDQGEFIRISIVSLVQNIIIGGLLAVLILWVFLRNIRSTLVIAASIPVSIVAAFVLVYFSGMTLNLVSLGGLALGVGMLVDNSIVVLESIFRHRQEGKKADEAALIGTTEVGGAVIASTLTTIAVFVPILFISGLAAEIFRELALTVSFSLGASLLIALTFVPMVASRMLAQDKGIIRASRIAESEGKKGVTAWFDKVAETLPGIYEESLTWALKRRGTVLLVSGICVAVSALLIPSLGSELIPNVDTGQIILTATLPKGASLSETCEVAARIEDMCLDIPEIETMFETIGSESTGTMLGLGGGQSDLATFNIQLAKKADRNRSTGQVAVALREELERIPGAEFKVSESGAVQAGALLGGAVQVTVTGDDLDQLKEISGTVVEMIEDIPGLIDVESGMEEGRPELQIVVDRGKAHSYGLTAAGIASGVRSCIQGEKVSKFRASGDEIDITVKLENSSRMTPQDIEGVPLATPLGISVPLGEVASATVKRGPVMIERKDQARVARVNAELEGRTLGDVTREIESRLSGLPLPYGYSIMVSGQAGQMAEAFGDLTFALILAIVLVYMVMAAQFESFIQPAIIMASLPLALIGVMPGLWLGRIPLSIPVFVGGITLAGIVVNNAIVLVDYTNQLRAGGLSREEAVFKAGRTRLRPILMTTLTTVLGLIPLVLGRGEGSEMQRPLAVTVAGGLAVSTLLTLIVVPVVYTLVDDIGARLNKKRVEREATS